MPYRALAFDIDGTLIDASQTLTPAVIADMQTARARGIKIFLVSGRMTPAMLPIYRQLELATPLVSYNGACVAYPEKILAKRALPNELTQEINRFAEWHNLVIQFYYDDILFVRREHQFTRDYAKFFGVEMRVLSAGAPLPPGQSIKALIISADNAELKKMLPLVAENFGARAAITTSSSRFIEILPPAINKAAGLQIAAAAENIALAEIVAVGDAMNDREMLRRCGSGLAVDNGDPELLAAIPRHIAPPYREGLAAILRDYFGVTSA